MKVMADCLAVGLGGFLGALARLLASRLCATLFGPAFPIGTLAINLSGSLLLGWLVTVAEQRGTISETARLAIAVGFLGAYTTFSTFMYESDALLQQGATIKAGANLLGSVALGLLAVRAGIWLGGGR